MLPTFNGMLDKGGIELHLVTSSSVLNACYRTFTGEGYDIL